MRISIVPSQVLEVNTMDLLIEFAKIGLGIGCVIREFVQEELDKQMLVTIPMKWPIKKRRTIGFAYNPGGTSRALENFLSFCGSFPIS